MKQARVSVDGVSHDYSHDSSGQAQDNLLWESLGFSFIATGASLTLSFMSLSGKLSSYGALIDNVQVTVPEPSVFLLGAMAFGAAVVRRRQLR